jgi:hypothetical protein
MEGTSTENTSWACGCAFSWDSYSHQQSRPCQCWQGQRALFRLQVNRNSQAGYGGAGKGRWPVQALTSTAKPSSTLANRAEQLPLKRPASGASASAQAASVRPPSFHSTIHLPAAANPNVSAQADAIHTGSLLCSGSPIPPQHYLPASSHTFGCRRASGCSICIPRSISANPFCAGIVPQHYPPASSCKLNVSAREDPECAFCS